MVRIIRRSRLEKMIRLCQIRKMKLDLQLIKIEIQIQEHTNNLENVNQMINEENNGINEVIFSPSLLSPSISGMFSSFSPFSMSFLGA